MNGEAKISGFHRERLAVVYLRQSSMAQVRQHTESTMRQYALTEEAARLGWAPSDVQVIDTDLGVSGRWGVVREGFTELVTLVCRGEVGAIFGIEISRLARSNADVARLMEFAKITQTLLIDSDGVYDPGDVNDRMLLGLKATMGEVELHVNECSSRRDRRTTTSCRSVAAACVDAAVAGALLDALTPEQVALALSAADQVTDRRQRVSRAAELALERSRYEADRAERAFHAVEPENRLVARTIEARWEAKLTELAEAEEALQAAGDMLPPLPGRAELERLASDLPALWHAPTTSAKDRKRLLRTLIADITLLPEPDRSKVRLELRTPLPVGYVRGEDDDVLIGSAYGVVAAFADRRFPLRAYGGVWAGQLRWGRLTHARVLGILKNPAYAGAYVFGRYSSRRSLDPDGTVHTTAVQRPRTQWPVLIKDHHQGYITWTQYLGNEVKLAANHTGAAARPPREGTPLCQGIIGCGSCGKPMTTNYHTDQRPAYPDGAAGHP